MCGAPKNWRELLRAKHNADPAWRQWETHSYRNFGFGVDEVIAAGAEYERKRPVRDASLESDVFTPSLQALISGVAGGVCLGALAAIFHWDRPFVIGLASGTGVMGLTWFVLLREHRDLLWEVERITGTDLDRDGAVGEPVAVDTEPEPRITRVEVTERKKGRIRYVDVPLSDGELERMARAVLVAKESFSQRGLGNILSQDQYSETYQAMLDGGLLRYKGKSARSGVELTGAGKAFLEQYLD
jgi:hypothetical protein